VYVIIVYDTPSKNCSCLCKILKRFLNWHQNSVFEGEVTEAQLFDIKKLLQERRAKGSWIIVYELKEPKNVKRTVIGDAKGNRSNVI
jgi:CRISPR-associated protein Cas2